MRGLSVLKHNGHPLFGRWLGLNTGDGGGRLIAALLIQGVCRALLEKMVSFPLEFDFVGVGNAMARHRFFLVGQGISVDCNVDIPERLGNKAMDSVELFDDKTKSRELAGPCDKSATGGLFSGRLTIADDLLIQSCYPILQRQSSEASHSSAGSKVKSLPSLDSIGLGHIEVIGIAARGVNLTGWIS